jgi:hypothetical protein
MCCTIVGMSTSYEPGIYVKGDIARRCETPRDAVAAVFEGFKLQEATPADQVEVTPDEQDDTAVPDTRPEEVNGHEDPFEKYDDQDGVDRLGSDFS